MQYKLDIGIKNEDFTDGRVVPKGLASVFGISIFFLPYPCGWFTENFLEVDWQTLAESMPFLARRIESLIEFHPKSLPYLLPPIVIGLLLAPPMLIIGVRRYGAERLAFLKTESREKWKTFFSFSFLLFLYAHYISTPVSGVNGRVEGIEVLALWPVYPIIASIGCWFALSALLLLGCILKELWIYFK